MKQQVVVRDLHQIEYGKAWELQEQLMQENLAWKKKGRDEGVPVSDIPTRNHLLFCEHLPVYTLGKSGKMEHVLLSAEEISTRGIGFYPTNRGGDITFHGPGQIVGYPIIDLEKWYTDIGIYLRNLEEVIIRTLAEYGLAAGRSAGETGVWLDAGDADKARKICAMGVRCSRWVTMHGFALNVNTDLTYFDHIVPCGIRDKSVTSLEKELGYPVPLEAVRTKIIYFFGEVFQCEMRWEENAGMAADPALSS
jgi:lipoyl(octanoyl) transferase